MIPAPVYILFGALFAVAVMLALGKLLLRALSLRFYRQEEHLLAFMCGAPVLSAIVFGLCATGIARKGVMLWLGLIILGFAFWAGAHRPAGPSLPPLKGFWKWLFGLALASYIVVYFFNAMAPEVSPDGSAYHLGLVARYLREHGFHRITTNMYANLSQGVEMLFLFAFAFGRHSSAAMVHLAFLVVLPLLMLSYARRFGFNAAGACAALFVFASPVVGIDGISAYIDVAVACIAFSVFYLLQIWDGGRDRRLLVPIGLLAGFAYAAKYTAFLAVPYALGFIAWKSYRKRQPCIRSLAIVSVCAVLVMTPWIAKNWIWAANPFSPFFNRFFPNPYITVGFEQEYAERLRHYDLENRWKLPWVAAGSGELSGLVGPLFLLAPIGLLALRRPAGRQLLLAALVFGIPYAGNIGTRFLIPCLPFVSLAMALVFVQVRSLAPALALAHVVFSWPSLTGLYCRDWAWRLTKIPALQALRLKSEEDFLSTRLPGYGIARLIDRTVPPGRKVLTFTPLPEAYTSRDILVVYQSASSQVSGDIQWTPLIPDYAPTAHLIFQFPETKLRRIRVVQTASGAPDYWSVSEFRVLRRGQELERPANWRIRAHPNPWNVQLAFDNSPVTRWRSAQRLFPGMFLEVNLSNAEPVDSVLLEATRDQHNVRLQLEGEDDSGKWRTLAASPQVRQGPPLLNLRRAAAEELKQRGIGYLVVFDSDYLAKDYRDHALEWNLVEVGESGGARLYRFL